MRFEFEFGLWDVDGERMRSGSSDGQKQKEKKQKDGHPIGSRSIGLDDLNLLLFWCLRDDLIGWRNNSCAALNDLIVRNEWL